MTELHHPISQKIKAIIERNLPKIEQEIDETKELYQLLKKWSHHNHLSKEEIKKVKSQLIDILKSIPALAIFIAPFGSILLYLLIKTLPFNILPSAFSDEINDSNQNT